MCMNHDMSLDQALFAHDSDLRWYPNGQVALTGALLDSWERLDRTFRQWGSEYDAAEIQFPSFIAVEQLQKMDYLQSFPQLATFAVNVKQDDAALLHFKNALTNEKSNAVVLVEVEPVQDVLTPAACYHAYIYLQDQQLSAPRYISTRNTCYRKEKEFTALQRQWAFNMRELVCLGGEVNVDQFLSAYREKISAFAKSLGIQATWQAATDPFFMPERNDKYLAQCLFPIKQELVLENGLAIASLNRHSQHFGNHFNIEFNNEPAFSGCVAFGLERWLYALKQVKS